MFARLRSLIGRVCKDHELGMAQGGMNVNDMRSRALPRPVSKASASLAVAAD